MKIKNIIIILSFVSIGVIVWFFNIGVGWKLAIDIWMISLIWIAIEIINAPIIDDDFRN